MRLDSTSYRPIETGVTDRSPPEQSGLPSAGDRPGTPAAPPADGVAPAGRDDQAVFENASSSPLAEIALHPWFGEPVGNQGNGGAIGTAIGNAIAAAPDPNDPDGRRAADRLAFNTMMSVEGGRTDFVDGVSPQDIKQGAMGDCYLMATLATVARQDPEAIKRLIKNEKFDSNGNLESCTVTLHQKNAAGVLVPVDVSVDCRAFGAKGALSAGTDATGRHELWPQIIEKAYAALNVDSYNGIGHGGRATDAMEIITGQPATRQSIGSYGFEQLAADLKAGKLVSIATAYVHDDKNNVLPGKEGLAASMDAANVKDGHSYAVLDCKVDANGEKWVKVYNPWGHDHPGGKNSEGWIKYDDAQKLFQDAAVGKPEAPKLGSLWWAGG